MCVASVPDKWKAGYAVRFEALNAQYNTPEGTAYVLSSVAYVSATQTLTIVAPLPAGFTRAAQPGAPAAPAGGGNAYFQLVTKVPIVWEKNPDPYTLIGDDAQGRTAIDLGVTGAPETFVIDRKGQIRYKHVGPIDDYAWENTLKPLVKMLEGCDLADVPVIVLTIDPCISCTER
jgi:hypothetical protein